MRASAPESNIVTPELRALAEEKGYTKQKNDFTTFNILPNAESPTYPAAMMYTFTQTDKDGSQKQGIQFRTAIPNEMQSYMVRKKGSAGPLETNAPIAVYPTQKEAEAALAKYKEANPEQADQFSVEGTFPITNGKREKMLIIYTGYKE
jgi:hypothetical protein